MSGTDWPALLHRAVQRRADFTARRVTTPRPWRVGKADQRGCVVADSDEGTHEMNNSTEDEREPDSEFYGGALIAESIFPPNAEFIVRAVNAFDPLVAAAEKVVNGCAVFPSGSIVTEDMEKFRAALAELAEEVRKAKS